MSKCYKCDRCGELLTDPETTCVKIKTIGGKELLAKLVRCGGYNDLDVCENCYKQFRSWWVEGMPQIAPIEDTILGRTEDISDPHPEEVRS